MSKNPFDRFDVWKIGEGGEVTVTDCRTYSLFEGRSNGSKMLCALWITLMA